LDEWQREVVRHGLGEDARGRWSAFEIAMLVPRQNGKGAVLECLELAGLFLLGEQLIIHSAHEFPTSLEAFRRLLFLIESSDDLRRRVKRVSRAHGEEGIELLSGQRIRFRTRTKGGGRGFTGDRVIFDEAMMLPDSAVGALMPTLSARPNPQIVYAASAVDQLVHHDGLVLARVRERGVAGDPGLAYFEWSVEAEGPDSIPESVLADPVSWAAANPALGIRIDADHVGRELRAMPPRAFAVERLNVGDWPRTDGLGDAVIDVRDWDARADPDSVLEGAPWFAFDVSPSRAFASIAVAGRRADGRPHVELVEYRRGLGWVVPRCVELRDRHQPAGFMCDLAGPAAALLPELEEAGIRVRATGVGEMAKACGVLFDLVEQGRLAHVGQDELRTAVRSATKRDLGDAWAWSRRKSGGDISPLVAVTLALWGLTSGAGPSVYERRGMLEFSLT
jgi:phage terminase large subunit-like protein